MSLLNPCDYAPWGVSCKTRLFINSYGAGIISLIENTGIFLPTIVGMVCLESGYGQSKITVEGFNFGGVKYNSNLHSAYIEADTYEVIKGKRVKVRAKFAKFKNVQEGLKGQYNTMMKERYRNARYKATSALEQVGMYVSAGYSTTSPSDYKKAVKGIVNACIDYKQLGRIGPITK